MRADDLRNEREGATVWVLGNAPSLTDAVIAHAEQDVLIVCNDFMLHPRWPDIDVDYYTCVDPGIADNAPMFDRFQECDGDFTWVLHECLMGHHEREIPVEFFCGGSETPVTTDFNAPMLGNTTVVAIVGIPLALWIGASRIVVAGVELDYSGLDHFYSPDQIDRIPYAQWICDCNRRFGMLADLCESRGVELLNVATRGNLTLPRTDLGAL